MTSEINEAISLEGRFKTRHKDAMNESEAEAMGIAYWVYDQGCPARFSVGQKLCLLQQDSALAEGTSFPIVIHTCVRTPYSLSFAKITFTGYPETYFLYRRLLCHMDLG